jgi:hypothetical protein
MGFSAPKWQIGAQLGHYYVFLTGVNLIIMLLMAYLLEKHPRTVGMTFLGASLLKILVSLLYLLPLFTKDTVPYPKSNALHFVIIYFIFLTVDSALILRSLFRMNN